MCFGSEGPSFLCKWEQMACAESNSKWNVETWQVFSVAVNFWAYSRWSIILNRSWIVCNLIKLKHNFF